MKMKSHFSKKHGQIENPAMPLNLYTDSGSRKRVREPHDDRPVPARKTPRVSSAPESLPGSLGCYDDESLPVASLEDTQPLAWATRTPKRKQRNSHAPAISPNKRRTLIEQSAKDVAFHQHTKERQLSDDVRSSPLHSRNEAPSSPLRNTFALSYYEGESSTNGDSATLPETIHEELCRSPLSERGKRTNFLSQIEYPRSPRSHKIIYAYETQADPSLQSFSTDEFVDLSESNNAEDSFKYLSTAQHVNEKSTCIGARESYGKVQNSSPPSSQTAQGGSWSAESPPHHCGQTLAESLTSRNRHESSTTDSTSIDVKAQGNPTIFCPQVPGTVPEEETQPLSWDDNHSDFEGWRDLENVSRSPSKRRIQQDWANVHRVWTGVLTDRTNVEKHKQGQSSTKQSQLDRFGFCASATTSLAPLQTISPRAVTLSDAEDVLSDFEEEIGDTTLDAAYVQPQLMLQHEGAFSESETQSLPWEDDLSGICASPSASVSCSELSLPSDSGLDVRLDDFLTHL